MPDKKTRAAIGMVMAQSAINLVEQMSTEVGGDLMELVSYQEKMILENLARISRSFLRAYETK